MTINKTGKILIALGIIILILVLRMYFLHIDFTDIAGQSLAPSNASICWIEKNGEIFLEDDINTDSIYKIYNTLSALTVKRSHYINTSSFPLTFQEPYSDDSVCEVLIRLHESKRLIRIIEMRNSDYIIIVNGSLFCYKSVSSSQNHSSIQNILVNNS